MEKKSFALGYSYVVHSFVSYMFMAFVLVAFSNVVFPGFIAKFGWDSSVLASINTIAAIIGSLSGLLVGQWVDLKGPKQVLVIGFLVGGVNMIIFGNVSSIATFAISLIIMHICMQAFAQMTTNNLIARWFNKKKGVILGITTAGLPASTAIFLPLYANLNAKYGMQTALAIFGVGMIAMGIISIFWVKDTPQEIGLTPDNLPVEEKTFAPTIKKLSFRQVIQSKTVWIFILAFGFMFCATIASVAELVPYLVQKGFILNEAVTIMGLAAASGIAGSFIFGVIDQKTNTKIATIIYCVVCIIVYAGMFLATKSWLPIFIVCAFLLNGAPGNLLPSMLISVFGSGQFNSIFKFIMPIVAIMRSTAYVFVAISAKIAGGNIGGVYIGLCLLLTVSLILVSKIDINKHVKLEETPVV